MRILWAAERFTGFGRDPFSPSTRLPETTTVSGRRKSELKAGLQAQCPKVPGVYGMLDASGRLIYVGKSKSLRTRLLTYFSPKVAREKPGHILRETSSLVWEPQPSEFAALLRELYLIRTWRPRWNVKDQPRSARLNYLCVGRGPARHLFVTTSPPKGSVAFGPIHSRSRLNRAAEALNHHYGLRDCTGSQEFRFSDQRELFEGEHRPGCLRFEIGSCLGPCAGGCTRRSYAIQVAKAKSFLEGRDSGPTRTLLERMTRAAAEQRFETAALLRDKLTALEWLTRRLEYLRTARETFNFVYQVPSSHGPALWYLIASGCVATAIHSPADRRRRAPALRAMESWSTTGRLEGYPVVEQHPTITLLSHWFRTRPHELAQTMTVEDATSFCRADASRRTSRG